MKNGFNIYDAIKNKPYSHPQKLLQQNKTIIYQLKINDIQLNKIIKEIMKDNPKTILDLKEIKRLSNKYKKLKEFIQRLISEYNKYCCLISYIIDDIFDPFNSI